MEKCATHARNSRTDVATVVTVVAEAEAEDGRRRQRGWHKLHRMGAPIPLAAPNTSVLLSHLLLDRI